MNIVRPFIKIGPLDYDALIKSAKTANSTHYLQRSATYWFYNLRFSDFKIEKVQW